MDNWCITQNQKPRTQLGQSFGTDNNLFDNFEIIFKFWKRDLKLKTLFSHLIVDYEIMNEVQNSNKGLPIGKLVAPPL